ncbi:MAG: glycosyltransferase family 9 protein [Ignavibacteria bacterium]|nr:glycosyltransferase family 9 protein [Ignavibacteria bacterium]
MSKAEKVLGDIGLKFFKGFVLERDVNPAGINKEIIIRILVIIRHQFGDMLCSLPMLQAIRNEFKNAEIILVTKSSTKFKEIFKGNISPVNEVIEYESGFENFINLIKLLREKKINLAVVPSTVIFSATNHLVAYYSNAAFRVGVRSRDFLLNKAGYVLNIKNDFLWDSKRIHQVNRNLDVIKQIGIEPVINNIELQLTNEENTWAEEYYRENFPDAARKVIGIHPGAAKPGNVWPAEKFAELLNLLSEKFPSYFYISEGPDDKKYINKLDEILKHKYPLVSYKTFYGDLMKNAANISKTALFISNDTGIMHLASAFKMPVIGLFGPTNAFEWGPLGNNKASVQASGGKIENIEIINVFETCLQYL